jgi:hypothetical protein
MFSNMWLAYDYTLVNGSIGLGGDQVDNILHWEVQTVHYVRQSTLQPTILR